MISFEELHHFMMLDVFYGVESKATDSIINSIYREYPENPRMGSPRMGSGLEMQPFFG